MEGVFGTCSVMDKMIGQWYECSEGTYTDMSEMLFRSYEVSDNTAPTLCITSEVHHISVSANPSIHYNYI